MIGTIGPRQIASLNFCPFQTDGSKRPLDIDTLGNMLEASMLSPNSNLYGSVHNNGHSFSAYMHDPQHRYLVS